jgi:FK506-binding protein 4/5
MADVQSSTSTDQQRKEDEMEIPQGAVDISPNKNGGVWKTIVKDGQGEAVPARGDTCHVHYTGILVDGTKFDSSRDRGVPFEFKLGRDQVIKGWDVTVATMKKGETCKVILKSEYGYGALGSEPTIPPNATLIFEIELLKWEGEDISPDKDKSILRSILKEGEKFETPNENSKVETHITGWHDGRKFFDSDVSFVLGEATESGLPEGVDKAVKRFLKGEHSMIHLKSKWGYGERGNTEYNIPSNADIDFEIVLKSFEKAKQSWEMEEDEKMDAAEKLKQRGTEFFQQGKNKLAIAKYKGIIELLEHETGLEGEAKEKRRVFLIAAHNNLAMVYLKTNETAEAIRQCEKALTEDPKNVKALYRQAQAYQNQNDFEDAIKIYERVVEVEPNNKAAQANIIQCRKRLGEERTKQKAIFANMFEKLSKADDKTPGYEIHPNTSSESQNVEQSENGDDGEKNAGEA